MKPYSGADRNVNKNSVCLRAIETVLPLKATLVCVCAHVYLGCIYICMHVCVMYVMCMCVHAGGVCMCVSTFTYVYLWACEWYVCGMHVYLGACVFV